MKVAELLNLSGRVALVTGASRGLGLAMAAALGEAGARIAISARKAPELAEAQAGLARDGTPPGALPPKNIRSRPGAR